ncbi:MAG: biotin/lipoyl-binding protein, partial [Patescibacteria group bacterium]
MMILKNKYFYLAVAVAIGGLIGYNQYQSGRKEPSYETVKVARRDLTQTVSATGKIESVDDLSLSFEVPGTVGEVRVKEGDKVKSGAILATLKLSDLNAIVAQASANLKQKLAGATTEDRNYYKAAVDSALATLNQSKVDVAADIVDAESSVETAKNNLKLAEGGDDSQIVNQAYEGTVAILQSSISKLDDGLTQADNILGIDNMVGNESFKKLLAVLNLNLLDDAKRLYYESKNNNKLSSAAVLILQPKSDHKLIDSGAEQTEKALISLNKLLATVSSVLSASITDIVFTPTVLDAKKTLITTTRNAVNTQYDTLTSQKQTITNAKNSYQTYLIAYNKALANLDQEKKNADSAVAIKQAGYEQALANYQSKINPPRAVDVSSFRAALALAIANRDKAIIKAPIDGLVTKITAK